MVSAEVVVSNGLTNDNVNYNVDYGTLDDDDYDNDVDSLEYTKTLTIQNNGNLTETVTLSVTDITNDYVFELLDASSNPLTGSFNLDAGATKDIQLKATVPIDADSGLKTVAKLNVNSNTYNINTDVESMLDIEEIEVYVDGSHESKKDIGDDGDSFDEIYPGNEVELRFKIRNLFDKDYKEGDIEDIELTLQFADSDDEDDFEDDIDEDTTFDLDADEKVEGEDVVLKFTVPDDARDSSYTLEVNLEGEDGNGAIHTVDWEFDMEVEREDDDVRIVTAEPVQSIITTCDNTLMFTAELQNYGNDEQKYAGISIYNKELDINENVQDIDLEAYDDNDNNWRETFSFDLDGVKKGTYDFDVNAYINRDDSIDYKRVRVTIEDCAQDVVEEEEEEETPNTTVITTTLNTNGQNDQDTQTINANGTPVSSSNIVATTENSYSQDDYIVAILVVGIILILAMIILFVVILLKR